jgi:hypothetical protein
VAAGPPDEISIGEIARLETREAGIGAEGMTYGMSRDGDLLAVMSNKTTQTTMIEMPGSILHRRSFQY